MHLSGEGDATTEPAWWEKLLAASGDIAKSVTSAQMTRDIYKINKERAKQGLPPITSSQLSPTVNVGVDPRTIQSVGIPMGLLAAGLLAILFLRR